MGGITSNWIPSEEIRNKVLDATWSYRRSMLGVQDLVMSSYRTIRFLAVSANPAPLGSYGASMFVRQGNSKSKMISSVKETHMHITDLRQIPPPVTTQLGLRPTPEYNVGDRFPLNETHLPEQPGKARGYTAGNPISSLYNYHAVYAAPTRAAMIHSPAVDHMPNGQYRPQSQFYSSHATQNDNQTGMWMGYPSRENSNVEMVMNNAASYSYWNSPRTINPQMYEDIPDVFPSTFEQENIPPDTSFRDVHPQKEIETFSCENMTQSFLKNEISTTVSDDPEGNSATEVNSSSTEVRDMKNGCAPVSYDEQHDVNSMLENMPDW